MWAFSDLPTAWLRESYGIDADSAWTNTARRGALRFGTNCSASFVSERGLVLTNHHCVRDLLKKVQQPGEDLLTNGFLAPHDSLERRIPGLYVDELVRIDDVTQEVLEAASNVRGAGPRMDARRKRADAIERRMNRDLNPEDSLYVVEVFETVSAVSYDAYVYRRHRDVRLAFIPDVATGYFGGDPDNFSWPRHTLDMAILRVADTKPTAFFPLDPTGAEDGEAVFAIGNPGTTNRLSPVSLLEYKRDVELPNSIAVLRDRRNILRAFVTDSEQKGDSLDLRDDLMSLENMLKSEEGQHEGLVSGNVLPVRYSREVMFRDRLAANDSLKNAFGDLHLNIAQLQGSKRTSAIRASAFTHFANPVASSHVLTRGLYGYVYTLLKQRGAEPSQLAEIRKEALEISDWPESVERAVIAARLQELASALGSTDPSVRRLIGTSDPAVIADSLVAHSALMNKASFEALLDGSYLSSDDVSVPILEVLGPLYFTIDQELSGLITRENSLMARLEEARFRVFGADSPPDASFKLRLSDGRVAGIDSASAFTRISGMFDLASRHAGDSTWTVTGAWQNADTSIREIPLNLVSTVDITGGSSGSPLVDSQLRLVGLVFDSNGAALPSIYTLSQEDGRTIAVDVRAIIAALGHVYGAERLLVEMGVTE